MFAGEIVLNMFETVEDGIASFNVRLMVAIKSEMPVKDNTKIFMMRGRRDNELVKMNVCWNIRFMFCVKTFSADSHEFGFFGVESKF